MFVIPLRCDAASGRVVVRLLGPRKTITLFFIVAFAGSVVLGLAPTVTWAIAGRTLVGIGVAMLFVPTLKILAEWFKPTEFAVMTGILLAMGGWDRWWRPRPWCG